MNPEELAFKIENLTLNVGEDRIDPETARLIEVYNLDPEDISLGQVILERLKNIKHVEKIDPYPLAIPVDQDVHGPIELGFVSQSERTALSVFGMYPKELCRHILAVGPTGSGKTNLNYQLIQEAHKLPNVKSLVFSFMKEYRPLTRIFPDFYVFRRGQFKMNPLNPMGLDFGKWANYFAEIFGRYEELRIASKGFILKQLYKLAQLYSGKGYPSLFDFLTHIETLWVPRYKKESDYKQSSAARLGGFLISAGIECKCSQGIPLNEILKMNTVIELDGLLPEYQATIISFILNWILLYKLQTDNGLINVVVIDEAQNVFSKQHEKEGISPISTLVSQVRKSKVGLVINVQIPRLLNESVLANTDTKIVLGIGDGRDAELMQDSMGLNYQQQKHMFVLDQEDALVRLGYRFFKPFSVKIPLAYEEQIISDLEIDQNNQKVNKDIARKFKERVHLEDVRAKSQEKEKPSHKKKSLEKKKVRNEGIDISTDERKLLANIRHNPFEYYTKRKKAVGCGISKLNNLRDRLIEKKLITKLEFTTRKQGNDPILFDITVKGLKILGWQLNEFPGAGSFLHRAFQQRIAEEGKKQRYQVSLEKEFNGKRVDVLWMKKGETIGFEVALMSESHEVENIKRCMEAGISQVVSYCRTNEIKKKIEAKLSQQNLFCPVEFRLLGEFIKKEA